VAHKCREFVYKVLQHTAPPEFKERITTLTVDAALQNALADGKAELKKLVADKSRHPITYNHYYTTTIQKMRQNKQREALKKAQFRAEVSVYSNNDTTSKRYLDPATMEAAMENSIILDMDKFSAEEALDLQRAFYKVGDRVHIYYYTA
jgi:Na+-translocating ferredoxin:NAD+ oxidoreductase RnfC subunit